MPFLPSVSPKYLLLLHFSMNLPETIKIDVDESLKVIVLMQVNWLHSAHERLYVIALMGAF